MKPSSSDFRQITLRLPRRLHARAHRLAKARRTSVNTLLRSLLEELDRRERERELVSAYDSIAGKTAEVEGAFEAQAEVARRG